MFCPLSTFFWRKSFKMEAIYCLSYFPLRSVCSSPKLHQLRLLPTLASFACHTWLVTAGAGTAVLSGMSVFKSSFVKDSPCAQWAWTCGLGCCQGTHRMSARHQAEGEQHPLWSQPICKLLVGFFLVAVNYPQLLWSLFDASTGWFAMLSLIYSSGSVLLAVWVYFR